MIKKKNGRGRDRIVQPTLPEVTLVNPIVHSLWAPAFIDPASRDTSGLCLANLLQVLSISINNWID